MFERFIVLHLGSQISHLFVVVYLGGGRKGSQEEQEVGRSNPQLENWKEIGFN